MVKTPRFNLVLDHFTPSTYVLVILPPGEAELQCGRFNILAARAQFSTLDADPGREEMNAMRQKETLGYGKESLGKGKELVDQDNETTSPGDKTLSQDEEPLNKGKGKLMQGNGDDSSAERDIITFQHMKDEDF